MYLAHLARWLLALKVTERDEHDVKIGSDPNGNIIYQCKSEWLARIHFPYWVLQWFRTLLRNIEKKGKLPLYMVSVYGMLCNLNLPEEPTPYSKDTRVSFVLATKNRADILPKCLDNIKEIITPNDELIVIDGGSADSTLEVLNRYKSIIDKTISLPDLNSAHAMNRGIMESRGRYVKQVCDDDQLNPKEFELSIRYMDEHPEIDLLVCGGIKQTGAGNQLTTAPSTYGEKCQDIFDYGACGTGFVYRRDSFSRFGMLNTEYINVDRELALRYISKGAIVRFFPGQHFVHTPYAHSASIQGLERWRQENIQLAQQYCPDINRDVNKPC
jgi:cellulose synthase/poly-beta-1,6-N-acetylglucosamine synthase-like glycosyltransferase